jgi:hypothetical protein
VLCLSKGDKDVIFPLFRRSKEGAGHLILEPLLSMHFLMVALCQDITRAKKESETLNSNRQLLKTTCNSVIIRITACCTYK